MTNVAPSQDRFLADTHSVFNQPPPLVNYNAFTQDSALGKAVHREGASHAAAELSRFGEQAGAASTIALGFDANVHKPQFNSHDRFGHRIDEVSFHPAYHQLMSIATEQGLHCSPWTHPGAGAHVTRAANAEQTTGARYGLGEANAAARLRPTQHCTQQENRPYARHGND